MLKAAFLKRKGLARHPRSLPSSFMRIGSASLERRTEDVIANLGGFLRRLLRQDLALEAPRGGISPVRGPCGPRGRPVCRRIGNHGLVARQG